MLNGLFVAILQGIIAPASVKVDAVLDSGQEPRGDEGRAHGRQRYVVELAVVHHVEAVEHLREKAREELSQQDCHPREAGHLEIVLLGHLGVDVGVVGDLGGGGHPVDELHDLHGEDSLRPEEHDPGDYVAEALVDDHGLVADHVGEQEDGDEEGEARVGPYRVHLAVDLRFGEIFKVCG